MIGGRALTPADPLRFGLDNEVGFDAGDGQEVCYSDKMLKCDPKVTCPASLPVFDQRFSFVHSRYGML